ncbi:MAG: hypothetical protein WB680_10830 [Candidatus Acidiferrales bacterium]
MNLPGAPAAREGFYATHFFTVKDQKKSQDLYVRILGGKVIKPENPCYVNYQPRLSSGPVHAGGARALPPVRLVNCARRFHRRALEKRDSEA